jgi:hypothetical protein
MKAGLLGRLRVPQNKGPQTIGDYVPKPYTPLGHGHTTNRIYLRTSHPQEYKMFE